MGLKFGTPEWIEEYLVTLNNNKVYEDAAKTWEGDFIFIIEPEGNLVEQLDLMKKLKQLLFFQGNGVIGIN
ncbi:MAG: hypothetical protein ACTSRX_11720 [Promethearchaeota archaeon]